MTVICWLFYPKKGWIWLFSLGEAHERFKRVRVFHAHPFSSFSRISFNESPLGAGLTLYWRKAKINRPEKLNFFLLSQVLKIDRCQSSQVVASRRKSAQIGHFQCPRILQLTDFYCLLSAYLRRLRLRENILFHNTLIERLFDSFLLLHLSTLTHGFWNTDLFHWNLMAAPQLF